MDGKPKFDLDQFNEDYFKRLRSRVIAAREHGSYVSVMLFQGWSIYSHGNGKIQAAGGPHPFKAPFAGAAVLWLRDERHSAGVIEFPRQTLVFQPTREDMTLGRVVFSVYCSKSADLRLNGVKPDPTWNDIHLTPAGEVVVDNHNRIATSDGSAWLYIDLTRLATNQFELPPLKLEFPTNTQTLLCLSVKVWFNEVSNQFDSMYYQNIDDRYALVSYCTSVPESSGVRSRFKQNRVATMEEFKQALGKPFAIKLNQRALRKEWAP